MWMTKGDGGGGVCEFECARGVVYGAGDGAQCSERCIKMSTKQVLLVWSVIVENKRVECIATITSLYS
jgi:hypothetical protein